MTPTEELKHEHKIILLVLQGTEKQADLPGGPNPAVVGDMVEFFVNFVDRCHHTKEEKHLFPKMEEHGIRHEGGPIGVMLHEHGQGRSLVAAIKESLATGHDPAGLKKNLLDYVHLLQSHIGKENEVLFVMADKVLTEAEQQDLSKAFAKVEAEEIGEGVHEKYHQLAHRLASEQK
ncbi:MAG: hemerythrin domain-containing protein [Syntrophorhabdaceae bacterium]